MATLINKTKYRDFSLNFIANPNAGDIGLLSEEDAVKQSIKTLLLTNLYERPFQPNVAGNITGMLFEQSSPLLIATIETRVEDIIFNYEPRAELIDINAFELVSENAISIKIFFRTTTSTRDIEFDVLLKRVA